MNDITTATNSVIDALKPLADKLGEGAAHIYELYVKQAYISGITELAVWTPFGIVLSIASIIFIRKAIKAIASGDYEYDIWPALTIVFSIIFLIIGVIVAIGCASDGIQHLLNPEYMAIQDLINQVTGKPN